MSPPTSRSAGEWLRLLTLALIWGLSFPAVDLALETLSPLHIATGRIFMGAIGLTAIAMIQGVRFPTTARNWAALSFVGIIGTALPFFLIGWGQQEVPPGATSLLMAVMPFITLGLAHAIGDERLTVQALLGMVLGFAGLGLLIGPDAVKALGGDLGELIFQAAILGGAVCYSLSAIVARQARGVPILAAGAVSLVSASAVLVPSTLILEPLPVVSFGDTSLWAVIYLGLFATLIAEILYFTIIGQSGASFFSLLNYMIPVIALAVSVAFLDEQPSWWTLVALPIILLGLWLGGRQIRD